MTIRINFPEYVRHLNEATPLGHDPIDVAAAVDRVILGLLRYKDAPRIFNTVLLANGTYELQWVYKPDEEWREVVRHLRREQVFDIVVDQVTEELVDVLFPKKSN